MSVLRRLLGRDELPAGFAARLDADERVLAHAALGGGGHVVATSLGLWLPGPRRLGWHLISKATWGHGVLTLVEAREVRELDGAVLLTDLPPVGLRLAEPGGVPEAVHQRVTASIKSRHRRDLPGGGAWIVARKVAGRDGAVLQVRPDQGTDLDDAAAVAAEAARELGFR